MFSFSSSSSSWTATPPAPSVAHTPQGNALFTTSMHASKVDPTTERQGRLTCILVDGTTQARTGQLPPTDSYHKKGVTDQASTRPRRVYSSSSYSASSFSAAPSSASHAVPTAQVNSGGVASNASVVALAKGEANGDTGRDADGGASFKNEGATAAATVSATRDPAVLSSDPYAQVQQQLHHPRVSRRQLRETAQFDRKAGGGSSPGGVPGWWSCESSVLPDNSPMPSSSSSSTSTPSFVLRAPAVANRALMAKPTPATQPLLKEKKQVDFMKSAGEAAVAFPVESPFSFSSSSSCGCPTSCSCRSERDAPHRRHREKPARRKGNTGAVLDGSSDASVTGTTSTDTSHTSDDSVPSSSFPSYCSCCSRCRSGAVPRSSSHSSTEGDTASLCSSCAAAAARTGVLRVSTPPNRRNRDNGRGSERPSSTTRRRRHDHATPYVQQDVFLDAVQGGAMWAEVPPLLHLSFPSAQAGNVAGEDDAAVAAGRARAELRAAYIRQAALLTAEKTDEAKAAVSANQTTMKGVTGVQPPRRRSACTQAGATMEEKEAEEARQTRERTEEEERRAQQRQRDARLAEEHAKALAAAQCAEVALPMLQRELESYTTRVSTQQQQQLDRLVEYLRVCQVQIQSQQTDRVAELRAQWEREQERAQELEQLKRRTSRREQSTSMEDSSVLLSTAAAAAAVVRHAVGTQHSDKALEQLAVVQSDAAAWLTTHLFTFEGEARRALHEAEEEARHQLLHMLEEPARLLLMRCQGEALRWQQRCMHERDASSVKEELRVLQLQERIARQELEACWGTCANDLWGDWQHRQHCAAVAAIQRDLSTAHGELTDTQQQLASLTAAHTDTLAHVRQLRLQLIHALRMPTVELAEATASPRMQPPGAPLLDAAFAYATATTGESGEEKVRAPADLSVSAAAPRAGIDTASGSLLRTAVEDDLPVHRRFARAHQEALRVVRAQCRTV